MYISTRIRLAKQHRNENLAIFVFSHIQDHVSRLILFFCDFQVTDEPELLLLILKCHLVVSVVDTLYYEPLVEYIINNQTPGEDPPYYLSVETIANQLQEAGHDAEAGTLMMMHRGTHPALRTFDTAMAVLSKWFVR